jgi:hypothetical protein
MAITKFYVDVNPFTYVASIRAKIGKDTYETEVDYTLPDFWATFSMGEDVFDIHFDYDGEFTAEVFSAEDNGVTQGAFPTKITLKLKD